MRRLSIRAYKLIGQGEGWALVGGSDNPGKVEQWILEHSGSGLIFHTGFAVLPREVLLELVPRAYEGIVYCAATKAIMEPIFPYFKQGSQLCHELNEGNIATWSVLQDWFFFSPAAPISETTTNNPGWASNSRASETADIKSKVFSEDNVVQKSDKEQPQDVTVLDYPIDIDGFDTYLQNLIAQKPALARKLTDAKITTVLHFHANWSYLNPDDAYEIAIFLMEQAQSPYRHLIQKTLSPRKEVNNDPEARAEAIIKIASFMPAWDGQIPIFSARLNNIIRGWGVEKWSDFTRLNAKQILRTPNLGLKTLNTLFQYTVTYTVNMPDIDNPVSMESTTASTNSNGEESLALQIPSYSLENAPVLAEALCLLLDGYGGEVQGEKKGSSDVSVLKDRLRGMTLEEIGLQWDLTREAIRQKTARCLRGVAQSFRLRENSPAYMWPLAGLAHLIRDSLRKDSCSQLEFNHFVKIFAQTEQLDCSFTQARMLQAIFSKNKISFVCTNLANKKVLLPVPSSLSQANLDELITAQADVPLQIAGLTVRDGLTVATQIFKSLAQNTFLASVLATDMVYSRGVIDSQGNLNYPDSVSLKEAIISDVLRILRLEGRPLHGIKEIYVRMPEAYRKSVGERRLARHIEELQVSCSPEHVDYIFGLGRGKYGLWEHMGVDDEHGRQCAWYVENHLNQHPVRQFSDKDLYDVLNEADMVTWDGDRVDRIRAVSVMLMRYRPAKVRYMGRFIWSAGPWTDERDTSGRYQIQDLVADFVKEQGKPVTKEQIDEHVRQYRGRGTGEQYFEHHGLIRLRGTGRNTLYWHESMDPEPFDSPAVQSLKQEILTIVQNGGAIFMGALKADIIQNSDIASKFNAMQFLALLLRLSEVTVHQNDQKKIVVQASEHVVGEIQP